ncbi:hypothetical protein [Stackebrandtia soli]|uniref:hypothetical protein n=1 Tax=Stackebrandtia soli TaxID=1892856 RepID=UPI0039E8076B
MTDVKDILGKTLPADEPPLTMDPQRLLARGQRRHLKRRIGFAGGGLAVIAAATAGVLLLPNLAPAATTDTAADSTTEEATEPPTMDPTRGPEVEVDPPGPDLTEHTEMLRTGFAENYPNLVFGEPYFEPEREPFALAEIEQQDPTDWEIPYSGGASIEDTDGARIGDVFVELYEPGGWTDEPVEMSRWAFHVMPGNVYSCWESADVGIFTECSDSTGPGGEEVVMIVQEKGHSRDDIDEVSVGAIIFRTDGTALKGYFECSSGDEDEESSAASCSADTMDADVFAEILMGLPEVPITDGED